MSQEKLPATTYIHPEPGTYVTTFTVINKSDLRPSRFSFSGTSNSRVGTDPILGEMERLCETFLREQVQSGEAVRVLAEIQRTKPLRLDWELLIEAMYCGIVNCNHKADVFVFKVRAYDGLDEIAQADIRYKIIGLGRILNSNPLKRKMVSSETRQEQGKNQRLRIA